MQLQNAESDSDERMSLEEEADNPSLWKRYRVNEGYFTAFDKDRFQLVFASAFLEGNTLTIL